MTHPWDPQPQQCKNYIHMDLMLLMENNSGAFLLADPISTHASPRLFCSLYDICMETRASFLSCSSHPAVCPSPKEDRLFREAVFMQIAGNDRRTVNTSQSRGANTKPGIHHCIEILSPFWWWKLLGIWEEFTGRLSEHLPWKTSLLLQDHAEKV